MAGALHNIRSQARGSSLRRSRLFCLDGGGNQSSFAQRGSLERRVVTGQRPGVDVDLPPQEAALLELAQQVEEA